MNIYAKALYIVGTQNRTAMLHHFMINSQGKHLICRARKILQGGMEGLPFNQAPFIESTEMCHSESSILHKKRLLFKLKGLPLPISQC